MDLRYFATRYDEQTTSIFCIEHPVIIEIYTDELNGSEDLGWFLGYKCNTLTSKSITLEVVMQITSKGQVTIPQDIRDRCGFLPHTEVQFVLEKGRVYIEKMSGAQTRGKQLIDTMRNKATVSMTTDEIMALTRER